MFYLKTYRHKIDKLGTLAFKKKITKNGLLWNAICKFFTSIYIMMF